MSVTHVKLAHYYIAMSSREEALCYLGIISYYILKTNKKRRNRQVWVKHWITKRERLSHVNLVRELREEKEDFHNYFRMPEPLYEELLRLVSPIIAKQDTCMREAISPHERLSVTLRFLITGGTYKDLMYSSAISRQSLGHIIPETCDAICSALKTYLKFPSSEQEWIAIAEEFECRWQFPNCLGAVDGKHIAIIPPAGAGSHFYNYKGYHSIVLMGIANANYEFIYVDIGTNGRISDGGVLQKTKFFQRLNSKSLNLPNPRKPSGHSEELPYVFIGDEAFALRTDFIKPYPQRQSLANSSKRIYNYRVCRARRIIENVFGILAGRFHIFRSPINTSVHNINKMVLACCVLHNFLRKKAKQTYSPRQQFDSENHENGTIDLGLRPRNGELQSLRQTHDRNPTQNAKITREKYETYFNTSGAIPWQHRML